ncbi:DNA polymerase III subunit delta' [Alteromonadaceae bacterium BrNp21-10]|nr:DNA polymerase III subunit delta' [Alteromonadaceae bacterium BrNp21-10]
MYPWLNKVFQQLSQRIQRQQLHHGILLQGVEGLGKAHFAKALADFLLCQKPENGQSCGECQGCRLLAAQSHPDMLEVRREKSQIGVDQIRQAIQQLTQTAQMSGNKVLIIYEAETLNQASSNALLKTLEEPTDHTYIILVSHQPQRLLPTILSRCEKITLQPPALKDGVAWLQQQGEFAAVEEVLALCSLAPLAALALLEQEEGLNYLEFTQQIQALQQLQISAVSLADAWQKQALQVVHWLQYWLSHNMRCQPQTWQQHAWPLHEKLLAASKQLQNTGVNSVLILANLLSLLPALNVTAQSVKEG